PISRLAYPMPRAPHAFARAMSTRRIPERSWRCTATSCPPASSTTTVSGAHLISAALASAPTMMRNARSSESLVMVGVDLLWAKQSSGDFERFVCVRFKGEALGQRHDRRLHRSTCDVDAIAGSGHDAFVARKKHRWQHPPCVASRMIGL